MNFTHDDEEWTDRLAERPEVFPHTLDLVNDRILLVQLSEAEVNAASFLDQRVLKQSSRAAWVPWAKVADSMGGSEVAVPAGFIFHVGHCGSTLLSRLLGFSQGSRSLREPLPLRTLAQDLADAGEGRSFLGGEARLERLRVLSKMWSRAAAHTVVKATSICTDLIAPLHALSHESRFVFMFNRLETHIATLLAGQNALTDLKGFAQLRLQRLQLKTGLEIELFRLSPAQLAVLSWLSETTSVVDSIERFAPQVALLEFESMLANPAMALATAAIHFRIPWTPAMVERALQSPVLQTYSKAPEHRYDAQTRAAILADARSAFVNEINAALGWAENLAGRNELVAAAMRKFA